MRRRSATGSCSEDSATEDANAPGIGIQEPVRELQRGRLAAARRADERDRLAGRQREGEPVQNGAAGGKALADFGVFEDGEPRD